jgi:membrane-associated phospholipid phosphatase
MQHPINIRRWTWWACLLPVAVVLLAVAVMPADVAISAWFLGEYCPGVLRGLFALCEVFGHGLGVLVILAVIHQLDPARRWALPRVALATFGAGLLANISKLVIARTRPRNFTFDNDVWSTFGDWFPSIAHGSTGQSMPSAHTAAAVGLAAALIWLYPRGRIVFPALVVLVAMQRINEGWHYPSDVLVGAALGLVAALGVLRYGHLPAMLGRLEARWQSPGISLCDETVSPGRQDLAA